MAEVELGAGDGVGERAVGGVAREAVAAPRVPQAELPGAGLVVEAPVDEPVVQDEGVDDGRHEGRAVEPLAQQREELRLDGGEVRQHRPARQRRQHLLDRLLDGRARRDLVVGDAVEHRRLAHLRAGREDEVPGAAQRDGVAVDRPSSACTSIHPKHKINANKKAKTFLKFNLNIFSFRSIGHFKHCLLFKME